MTLTAVTLRHCYNDFGKSPRGMVNIPFRFLCRWCLFSFPIYCCASQRLKWTFPWLDEVKLWLTVTVFRGISNQIMLLIKSEKMCRYCLLKPPLVIHFFFCCTLMETNSRVVLPLKVGFTMMFRHTLCYFCFNYVSRFEVWGCTDLPLSEAVFGEFVFRKQQFG